MYYGHSTCIVVIVQYCRGSGGRSHPALQGVRGAQPPGFAGGLGPQSPNSQIFIIKLDFCLGPRLYLNLWPRLFFRYLAPGCIFGFWLPAVPEVLKSGCFSGFFVSVCGCLHSDGLMGVQQPCQQEDERIFQFASKMRSAEDAQRLHTVLVEDFEFAVTWSVDSNLAQVT